MRKLKELGKVRLTILGILLTLGFIATIVFFSILFMQSSIEGKRNASYDIYEASSFYVSNEIHMLFSVDSVQEWDNAVRNSVMDSATRDAVYGTTYEHYRFNSFKNLVVTDLLYTIDDMNNIRYFVKVNADDKVYKILLTVNNNLITSFKIY